MQTLTGRWTLLPDPENRGREESWFRAPRADAQEAPVPGIIQQVFPTYHGVAWYWHTFVPLALAKENERYLLRFGAVDYQAEVWLNGTPVGGHEGGETPFTLDVTEALIPNAANLLAVRVLNPTIHPIDGIVLSQTPHRNKTDQGWRPGQGFNYGGIILPVELVIVPSVRVIDLFARPEVKTGQVRVHARVGNDGAAIARGQLIGTIEPANPAGVAGVIDRVELSHEFEPGETNHELILSIAQPRLWNLDDPYLYRVTVELRTVDSQGHHQIHQQAVRTGFRDFRVVDGYFHLNGKRIFLRSTHTGNHTPIGQAIPVGDLLRRDLLYAKATGFNMVRFISGMAYPEQLDLCDDLGLMVYEECQAAWLLGDSPAMAERFDRSVREMILRDRNHPSLTIWGMLNETWDGPVFRQAVQTLPLVRSLDDTRLVLLSSGRWDGHWEIGSVSNPGSATWDHVWGAEGPDASGVISKPVPPNWDPPAYLPGAGDVHAYPKVPQTVRTDAFIRSLGRETKPVFLSEYGIGSLMNVIRESRWFEQVGARLDLVDATFMRSWAENLESDWQRFGFAGVYPFAEDLLRESQRLHARWRRLGFDLIRSNPKICGYNLTGMLDHGMTGEGAWTFFREWKPEIAETLADGWAPLRWCLFVHPEHGYTGQTVRLEAVLANEDVLAPGEYPARLRVSGPSGVVWERSLPARIPGGDDRASRPFAVPILDDEVRLDGPAGRYTFAAELARGGAPSGGRLGFCLSDHLTLTRPPRTVTTWGIDPPVEAWLQRQGITGRRPSEAESAANRVILVGDPSDSHSTLADWQDLARRMAQGSVVVFLSPTAFKRGDDAVGWLPLARKGRCNPFNNWLYHKEDVAKPHPIFEGLPTGIMDWSYYGSVIADRFFDGQELPDEIAAAAFAPAYPCPGGYTSGVLVGFYRFGAGGFILSTLRVLESLTINPAADRLLINLIDYATTALRESPAPIPDDFATRLKAISYVE